MTVLDDRHPLTVHTKSNVTHWDGTHKEQFDALAVHIKSNVTF